MPLLIELKKDQASSLITDYLTSLSAQKCLKRRKRQKPSKYQYSLDALAPLPGHENDQPPKTSIRKGVTYINIQTVYERR